MGDIDDELARFQAEMSSLEGATAEPEPAAPAPAPRPAAAVVSAPAARASATIGGAPVPAAPAPPPVPPVPPPAVAGSMLPMPPMPPPPPIMPAYGMPQMYAMPPQMPPPPQFGMPTAMDPAVLAHMRQQMGAAAAATATAMVNAAKSGPRGAQQEIDPSKLHFRECAGEKWIDTSLSEWPDNDYRIFVGNLGSEVNDEVITRAFSKYPSFNMAKIVRDKKSKKSKGYGFASFSEQAEMYRVLKEMEGKYIGNRPCKLKKSTWDKREAEATEDDVEAAAKRLKENPTGGGKTAKHKRKHINILHN